MRAFASVVLTLFCTLSATAQELSFPKAVKASLVFREDSNAANHYPHLLKVFIRLDNVYDSQVSWVANPVEGIKAELLDAANQSVPNPPTAASIQSNLIKYFLPFGSRLDWLISHGGISMIGDAKDSYAIMVGSRGWLVPVHTASSYTLHVCLYGVPWPIPSRHGDPRPPELLLDLAPAKLEVSP